LQEKREKQSPYLLTSANGEKLCHSTLHDLKRKGISDSKNKNIGGHKTVEMQQRYNTKVEVFGESEHTEVFIIYEQIPYSALSLTPLTC
jgi:hypothetical protein